MLPEEYLQERLDDQIKWYDKKSSWNQTCFKRLRALEIFFPSAIPFLISHIARRQRATQTSRGRDGHRRSFRCRLGHLVQIPGELG